MKHVIDGEGSLIVVTGVALNQAKADRRVLIMSFDIDNDSFVLVFFCLSHNE